MRPRFLQGALGARPARAQGEPQRGGTSPLSEVLRGLVRNTEFGQRVARAEVTQAWREALGPARAARARVVAFRKGGELVVEVESAAHLHELKSFSGDAFVRAANQRLGSPRIRRATFQLKR